MKNKLLSTRNLILMAAFSALATVLMLFAFPLPFAPGFYEVDFSELPILIGAFAMGPMAGLIMELLKNLLHIITAGTHTACIGELANFISGSIFVMTAAAIYHHKKSKKTALIGVIAGTLLVSVASCFINAFITIPAYVHINGFSLHDIIGAGTEKNGMVSNLFTLLVFAVFPFNIIKAGLTSLLTMLSYKHVSPLIKEFTSK